MHVVNRNYCLVAAALLALAAFIVHYMLGGDALAFLGSYHAAAVYTPATLIGTKALGNGSGNISTWRYQNTGGANTEGIVRNAVFSTPTAARTVTVQQGATAADTTAQRLVEAWPLAANAPNVLPAQWIVVVNNDYFQAFANAADINGAAYGYTAA